MHFDPPLKQKYWWGIALVLLALVPDLLISSAMPLFRPRILAELHASKATLALGTTFSNAGWAFGAVIASDLFQRFGPRKPLLIYEALFVLGSILAAIAPGVWFVVAGRILQGLATGAMLVAALPPVLTSYPASRLGTTVTFTALGLFGAVTAGTPIGGYIAYTDTWHWFFATVALLGLIGLLTQFLYVTPSPPPNKDLRFDWEGIALAGIGSGLTFWGVGELNSYGWTNAIVWAPVLVGLICLSALIVLEFVGENRLMPLKLLSSTYPIIGILAAILSGLVFTGLTELLYIYLEQVRGFSPLLTGLDYWPAFFTSVATSIIFGVLFYTRYVLVLPVIGMLDLIGVAWLMTTMTTHTQTGTILWIACLLGIGAGLTVSPGLFVAALAVSPKLVGRAFSVIEMLRLAGAYAFVPAFTYFATAQGKTPEKLVLGLHNNFWVLLVIMAVTLGLSAVIFFLGGAHLHPANIEGYLKNQDPAIQSPGIGEAAKRPGGLGRALPLGFKSLVGQEEAEVQERTRQRKAAHQAPPLGQESNNPEYGLPHPNDQQQEQDNQDEPQSGKAQRASQPSGRG